MNAPFEEWLDACTAAARGGRDLVWNAARGLAFSGAAVLDGDWTGAEMAGTLRAMPDSGGALGSFTVTGPVVTGTTSTFIFTLAAGTGANSTGALPADVTGEGVAELALLLLLTPAGGTQDLFMGGTFRVLGV